jgi:hypothetical protein
MIRSIKLNVSVGEDNKELCFDLEEDVVSIYLGDKFICLLDYTDNFKEGIKKMIEQW